MNESQYQPIEDLRPRLAAEHLPGVPHEVTDKVFSKAYELGHSGGDSEIESWYIELAELIRGVHEILVPGK